jgi:hypothetical protein
MCSKRKIELDEDLAGILQIIGKRVPRKPGERPTYDRTLRWLIQTHPVLQGQVVEELTLQ